ncbi:hypothetical protein A9K55_005753 [Cordyceps militaris]|uniref:Uncharacterized protein n=1 Tax=Cordyceps militaris TaxID=73501 RepID=A0A2H4SC95_CORMI|nr:hypothetical protein A9K55_005753 [Cordyceps militaris]
MESTTTIQIGDLPAELLCQVFGQFAEPHFPNLQTLDAWKRQPGSPWIESRNALQNLRLVCRRFHDAASPLLFTYLSICVEQSSVERASEISRQPHLASCIRGVIIYAGLNSQELVDNILEFQRRMVLELLDCLRRMINGKGQVETREVEPHRYNLDVVTRNYHNITQAWNVHFWHYRRARLGPSADENDGAGEPDATEETETLDPDTLCYCEIMKFGHEEYKARTKEQHEYLETDAFLKDITACLTRLPHLEEVEVDSRRSAPINLRDILENNNLGDLRRYVEYAHQGPWTAPDYYRDYHFARIMTILPLSLRDAGIRLRTLRLGMIPSTFPRFVERPPGHTYQLADYESLMERLADASQTLESVAIRMDFDTDDYWAEFVDGYLRAVLSSKALLELDVDVPRPLSGTGVNAPGTSAYRVGQILSARSPERLRPSIEKMMVSCPKTRLEGIYLWDGLWADIVDAVKAARSLDRRVDAPRIRLHGLMGGEMGDSLVYEEVAREKEVEYVSMGYGGREPIVLMMAEQYLSGEGGVQRNPFREHKHNELYFRGRRPKH